MKTKLFLFLQVLSLATIAQKDTSFVETPITLETKTGKIYGTLCTPIKARSTMPVALIIAGSGPTDRDCNSPSLGLKTDAYKQLAHKLSEAGIASVRYDKRGIGESKPAMGNPNDLRFELYINDAKDWVQFLKADKRFSKITLIGHSEGSLIGMIAVTKDVAGYISVAGAGQSADIILKQQLSALPTELKDSAMNIIDSLVKGKTVKKIPQGLYTVFPPYVQPYEISWFKYDPQVEIKKLTIPVLIIQGTTDLQVGVDDAVRLERANPAAKLDTIVGMNHILKMADKEKTANISTYFNPALPINTEAVTDIISFIKK